MRLAHRVSTSAAPAEVWALLGRPRRWPAFNPFLRRVHGAPEAVRTGQTLLGVVRVLGVRVPLDVVEAVPEQRLELLLHTAPGIRHRLVFDVAPQLRGGSALRLTVGVEGLFARAAFVPLWLGDGVLLRVLVVQAEREARSARRSQGVA